MAFPFDSSLDLVAQLRLGDDLVDVSDRLLRSVPVRRGTADGARQAGAGSATLVLDDDDGALTPLNPVGDHYPHVRRGVHAWLRLRRHAEDFGTPAATGWGPDWTVLGSASLYSVSGGLGHHSHGVTGELRQTLLDDVELRDCEQVFEVETSAALTGAALVTGVVARYQDTSNYYWLRTEFDGDSTDVIVKISKVVGGVSTELAALDPVPSLPYSAATPLLARASIAGSALRLRVWDPADPEPTAWTIETTDDAIATPGQVGAQSWLVTGNTNALPVLASYGDYQLLVGRMAGEVGSYRPTIVPRTDGTMVVAQQVAIGGPLRRLEQGASPLLPALTRYYATTDPVAWWPLDDGDTSTRAASGLPGGAPMTATRAAIEFGSVAPPGAAGSASPALDAASALEGSVPSVPGATAWQVGVWCRGVLDNPADFAHIVPAQWTTGGRLWRIFMQHPNFPVAVGVYDPGDDTGALDSMGASGVTIDGGWHFIQVMAETNGANLDVTLALDGVVVATDTWSVGPLGFPARIQSLGQQFGGIVSDNVTEAQIAAITVHASDVLVDAYDAGTGYVGETAADRIARLCAEESVRVRVEGDPDLSMPMGPQRPEALLDLLRECETADDGLLYEAADEVGLVYRTRTSRYNQLPTLTVDLSIYNTAAGTSSRVLTPVYDDQGLRNDVTASRPDGSSARYVDDASVAADGRYDEELTVNVASDDVLPQIAAWLAGQGTVDEVRTSALPVDLAANPDLIDAWLSTDLGDLVRRTNIPAPQPPDPVDQVATGYSETLGPKQWSADVVGQPASPWVVGVVEDPVLGRPVSDGTTLGADRDDDDTSFSLVTPSGPVWIDSAGYAAMFPFDMRINGERVTVTAISGTTSPQTATVTRSVNGVVRSHGAGDPIKLWTPWRAAL